MLTIFLRWLGGIDAQTYREVWFAFEAPVAVWTGWALVWLAFGAGVAFWGRRPERRWGLAVLRASALALALFLVLGPGLTARRLQPGLQFVPVLLDNSQSMTVRGNDGQTRADRMAGRTPRFVEALEKSHQVVPFGFGERPERARGVDGLTFGRPESDLVGAVDGVLRRMAGVPVSAVVLFSDGVQQSRRAAAVEDLPQGVPVFTVGVDREGTWKDLALAGISVTRTEADRVAVTARVTADGLAGARAVVEVLSETRKVASAALAVTGDSERHSLRLDFTPQGGGWGAYQVRVRLAQAGEDSLRAGEMDWIAENNVRGFVVDNRERTYRILYFSGRPNWEHKFVRRALDGAPQLALSSLVRISGPERKFVFRGQGASLANPLFEGFDDRAVNAPRYDEAVYIRIGVSAAELSAGYPMTPEALFRYHLVIWGEIERDFFSQGQLDLTRDFVAKRGGSLMLMGGPRSFAGGNWQHSTIEPMLPVVAGSSGDDQASFRPRPTIEGVLSGVWALDSDAARNARVWADLPALFGANAFAMTRVGASVLATVDGAGAADGQPLFAWQRYGEGMCAALATGETWQWQMMTPEGDGSHARFWRQLARALVTRASEPVALAEGGGDVVVGGAHDLRFVVRDSLFSRREGLSVDIEATGADGRVHALPVTELMAETGAYTAAFRPESAGVYRVQLAARDADGVEVGRLETAVLAHPDDREFAGPRYDPAFLRRIAAHTGGAFFTLDDLDDLVARIPWTDSQNTVTDRFALWHRPSFYGVLALLFVVEWYLRRKGGGA